MGHIDSFVKYKIMRGDKRLYYLLAAPSEVVNPVYLEYWRGHIVVISDANEIAKLSPFESAYSVNWNWVFPSCDDELVFAHEGFAATQRAWADSGRPPLLQLRSEHAEILSQTLQKWGLTRDDKFVCLHVRSSGFYGSERDQAQRFRNTDIESYYDLIRYLVRSGRWVIRMGDPSMPALDLDRCGASKMVIDYARSEYKSSLLDVALCAECELFVSTSSGLHVIPKSFGRPVCNVNNNLFSGYPWHPGELFIFQRHFSKKTRRALKLEHIIGTNVIYCDHHFLLDRADIFLEPNSPEEIVETVKEALSPSTYCVDDEAAAGRVRATFEDLNRRFGRQISGSIGKFFAMKHASTFL